MQYNVVNKSRSFIKIFRNYKMIKNIQNESERICNAVQSFVDSLTPESKNYAILDFNSKERFNWHYIPKPRKGLSLLNMSDHEKLSAFKLLEALLSPSGFSSAKNIIEHEIILGKIEGSKNISKFDRDPMLYYFTIFLLNKDYNTFGIRIEGHHLSINISVYEKNIISVTPNFFGANPAHVETKNKKVFKILNNEEDISNDIFHSLNSKQLSKAIIYDEAPDDLITKTDFQININADVGLSIDLMTNNQIKKLYNLIKVYTSRSPVFYSHNLFDKLKSVSPEKIYFGWAGSPKFGEGNYYRISTPLIFIEYDNTQDSANHIHSVLRYRNNDFGANTLIEHYQKEH
ncbi:MAG: DUF3500 domain-containing protein [SAR202 cluster bacterium]|nr:DUF3500 domain-containing protein [SAR202 cluster bacterium]